MNWTQAHSAGSQMSSSATATPASAATCSATPVETAATAGALKSATATTGATLETTTTAALKAAAAPAAPELLAACRTALGKSTGLSPIAGIEGRALRGNVAPPAATAKLRGA
jgi:hypothetical protein